MPIGKIVFNLDTEKREFEAALKYIDAYLCIIDLDNHLRNEIKHNPKNYSTEQGIVLEEIREILHEIIIDRGVDLDLIP